MKTRIHITAHGLVQGVFFRANTVDRARKLTLTGWVRNGSDGESVEIVAEGNKEKLEELLKWTRSGPATARVDKVESKWEDYKGEFSEFKVNY